MIWEGKKNSVKENYEIQFERKKHGTRAEYGIRLGIILFSSIIFPPISFPGSSLDEGS